MWWTFIHVFQATRVKKNKRDESKKTHEITYKKRRFRTKNNIRFHKVHIQRFHELL